MSRLLSSLRTTSPPSPPETEIHEPIVAAESRHRQDSPDTSYPYQSRRSSMYYRQGESQDTRRAKLQRWLVVVMPPSVLDSSAASATSSAVLLPLFPTMYGQLAAIAKEYNLPSTTGLRIHVHLTDASHAPKARITEEVWPLLWSHFFSGDDRHHAPMALPIGGRIEFDIDLQAARWFNSWLRSRGQYPTSFGASPVNRGVDEEDEPNFDAASEITQSRPTHIRQLSLLERRPSARGAIPLVSRTLLGRGDSAVSETLNPSRPISQAPSQVLNNPRDEVESMVHKWRANTPTVQPGIPASSPIVTPHSLDLDDFSWSISSAGPLTYDPFQSFIISPAIQSMHMADRAAGSVCLTPSTATSFGPPRSGFTAEADLISNASRYPTPDLGARAMDFVPLTPTTATSWGPLDDDFDYDTLLLMADSYHPSPDLAMRMLDDVPVTPSTATTWGPLDDTFDWEGMVFDDRREWLPGMRTPDIGERLWSPTEPAMHLHERNGTIFNHVWPYMTLSDASENIIFNHVWPYTSSSGAPGNVVEPIFNHVWPYTTISGAPGNIMEPVFNHVWPYTTLSDAPENIMEPIFRLVWPYVYASSDSTLSASVSPSSSERRVRFDPNLVFVGHTFEKTVAQRTQAVKLPMEYPSMIIYAPVYPNNLDYIYPEYIKPRPTVAGKYPLAPTALAPAYPTVVIYSPQYPYNVTSIYPAIKVVDGAVFQQSTILPNEYPALTIYAPVYPYNLDHMYPSVVLWSSIAARASVQVKSHLTVSVRLPISYPNMELYRAVYPHNLDHIYPSVVLRSSIAARAVVQVKTHLTVSVRLPISYPNMELYRAVYPHNLNEIYPLALIPAENSWLGVRIILTPSYPNIEVYRPVYPHNLESIYPTESLNHIEGNPFSVVRVMLPKLYPKLEIYKSVYPYNLDNIYPAKSMDAGPLVAVSANSARPTSKDSNAQYPYMCIYPAVYPYFSVYPPIAADISVREDVVTKLPYNYPFLFIYKEVYPSLLIYPQALQRSSRRPQSITPSGINVKLVVSYPSIVIYESVYPFFDIYSGPSVKIMDIPVSKEVGGDALDTSAFPNHTSPSSQSWGVAGLAPVPVDYESEYGEDEYLEGELQPQNAYFGNSVISFTEEDLDIEFSPFAPNDNRASHLSLSDIEDADDEEALLRGMGSPERRFYLARQRDLRVSPEYDEEEGSSAYDEEDDRQFDVAVSSSYESRESRPSLSLNFPREFSGFFEDVDSDEEFGLEDGENVVSPPRFPRPNLSAVAEESSPFSADVFSTTHSVAPLAPTRPLRGPDLSPSIYRPGRI